jgi:hypothetical protein
MLGGIHSGTRAYAADEIPLIRRMLRGGIDSVRLEDVYLGTAIGLALYLASIRSSLDRVGIQGVWAADLNLMIMAVEKHSTFSCHLTQYE